jgi:hypothetical protein
MEDLNLADISGKKKRGYFKEEQMKELARNSKNKNTTDLYRAIK